MRGIKAALTPVVNSVDLMRDKTPVDGSDEQLQQMTVLYYRGLVGSITDITMST